MVRNILLFILIVFGIVACGNINNSKSTESGTLNNDMEIKFDESWHFYSSPVTSDKGSYGRGELLNGNIHLIAVQGARDNDCAYSLGEKAFNGLLLPSEKVVIYVNFFGRNTVGGTFNVFLGDSEKVFKLPLNADGVWEFYIGESTGKLFRNGSYVADIGRYDKNDYRNKITLKVDACNENNEVINKIEVIVTKILFNG